MNLEYIKLKISFIIRIKRNRERYATSVRASVEAADDPGLLKYLQCDSIKNLKVPKNTLKIIFNKRVVGYDSDGFARNIRTIIFYYNIITFKR